MTKSTISRLLGAATAVLGVWMIFMVWHAVLTRPSDAPPESVSRVFAHGILFTLPGLFAAYCGYRLARVANKQHVVRCVGTVAFFGAIWILSIILSQLPPHERISYSASVLITITVVVPFYVLICNWLIERSETQPFSLGDFLGKPFAFFLAYELWNFSGKALETYAPIKEGYTHLKESPWMWICLLGPFCIAWVSYKMLVGFLEETEPSATVN